MTVKLFENRKWKKHEVLSVLKKQSSKCARVDVEIVSICVQWTVAKYGGNHSCFISGKATGGRAQETPRAVNWGTKQPEKPREFLIFSPATDTTSV